MPPIMMTSRERIKAAMRCEEIDKVPCAPYFYGSLFPGKERPMTLREQCETYAHFGLDGIISIYVSAGQAPGVTSDVWTSEGGALVHKAFHTPTGDFSATIRPTADALAKRQLAKDNIALLSDFNPAHFVKPWIQTAEDVERFRYVHQPPDNANMAAFKKELAAKKKLAEEFGFPLVGHAGYGLTWLVDLMGAEASVFASMDDPPMVERFMEIEHQVNLKQMEILLDHGIDIIRRDGFYETTEFWTPGQLQNWVMPCVNKEADLTHAHGGLFVYTVCTGILPMLNMLYDSHIDGIDCFETKLCGQSLEAIASKLAGTKCLWGGLSDCEDLGRSTPDGVRQTVRDVFKTAGRKGIVLAASPSIKPERPLANVLAMFDEWEKCR